jgi:hypothetical protein
MENKKLGKKKELKSNKYHIFDPKKELNENEIEK